MTLDPVAAPRRLTSSHWLAIGTSLALAATAGAYGLWTTMTPGPRVAVPAAPAVAISRPATADPSWALLTPTQRQLLAPLEEVWGTMTPDRQLKWQVIAERAARKPAGVRLRLQARMVAWASLTPDQRAKTRLNYLRTANRYGSGHRSQSWASYQDHRPPTPASAPAAAALRPVSPVVVQAPRGATTMLMTELYALPPGEKLAQLQSAPESPPRVEDPVESRP